MYDELELDKPQERELLAKVTNRTKTTEENNELLDLISEHPNGGQKLDEIKNFENSLIVDFNKLITMWQKLESDLLEVGYLETQVETDKAIEGLKSRYKSLDQKSDETYEAIKIAFFQIDDFNQYYQRLYDAKENLSSLED